MNWKPNWPQRIILLASALICLIEAGAIYNKSACYILFFVAVIFLIFAFSPRIKVTK